MVDANARAKGKVSKRPQCPIARVLLAETECGAEGVEVVAQPVPAHHDLDAVPVETRDTEVAVGGLHASPTENRFPREMLAEENNALGLDSLEFSDSNASNQKSRGGQVVVNYLTLHRSVLLALVQPELSTATFNGFDDVGCSERFADFGKACDPCLAETRDVLGRITSSLKCISKLVQLSC